MAQKTSINRKMNGPNFLLPKHGSVGLLWRQAWRWGSKTSACKLSLQHHKARLGSSPVKGTVKSGAICGAASGKNLGSLIPSYLWIWNVLCDLAGKKPELMFELEKF